VNTRQAHPEALLKRKDPFLKSWIRDVGQFFNQVFKVVVPFVILLGIWWWVKVGFGIDDTLLVSPPAVFEAMWDIITRGMLTDFIAASLRRLGFAALVSAAIGIPLGLMLGANRFVAKSLESFLRFFQGISGIAWLPLVMVWYGFSETTILVIVVYTLIVPVIFNTMVGIRAVPSMYVVAVQSLGGSRRRLATNVYLPGALPSILVGMRLGMGYGWRALIAAEMLVRRGGLGDLIFGARPFGLIDRIMAGMIVIGTLYIIVDRLLIQPIEDLSVARWGMLRA
jgi:taurine transport system permease protein